MYDSNVQFVHCTKSVFYPDSRGSGGKIGWGLGKKFKGGNRIYGKEFPPHHEVPGKNTEANESPVM